MDSVTAVEPWGPEEGSALRQARVSRGDTQPACARMIAQLAGATAVTQGTIYSWEKGRHGPSSSNRLAIEAYVEGADAAAAPSPCATRVAVRREAEEFRADAGLTHPLTGERELSERQAALVDMLISEGGSLNESAMEGVRFAARVLGLEGYLDGAAD